MLSPQPHPDGHWQGQVLHIDHFGNLITNFQIAGANSPNTIVVKGHCIEKLSHTFGDVAPGELVAYAGSSGYLEIAVRDGNAARTLGMDIGDLVQVGAWR